jgi:AcrR family transcriptional regulator
MSRLNVKMSVRPYRARSRPTKSERTRAGIKAVVFDMLEAGRFHDSTMEEIAAEAGISRATLYQHFRSRVDLVDAICETFAGNPALIEVKRAVDLPDPIRALDQTVASAIEFWASVDGVLRELYGVVALDPAAAELVRRQREDRRSVMRSIARRLHAARMIRPGVSEGRALDRLMVLTSYETYSELRLAGRSTAQAIREVQQIARELLLAPPA